MKNEQKKEYTTPEMKVVELKHEVNLLVASDNGYGGGFTMSHETEEYQA